MPSSRQWRDANKERLREYDRNYSRQESVSSVYALADPLTGEIRYIGVTKTTPSRRLNRHLAIAKNGRAQSMPAKLREWIIGLKSSGYTPVVVLLQQVPHAEAQQTETAWIRFYQDTTKLLNSQKL